MASQHREVERKYTVEPGAALPPLGGADAAHAVPGVAEVSETEVLHLEALYLDTADLALARAGATLRRRTGGHDAGWHLKLPRRDGARQEVSAPLDEAGAAGDAGDAAPPVPAELAALVWVLTRDQPLVPVARLTTERSVRLLRGAEGSVLAEVADDAVVATRRAPGAGGAAEGAGAWEDVEGWRELEVELVDGDEALLDAVEARLAAGGVVASASSSKLARALGLPTAASVSAASDTAEPDSAKLDSAKSDSAKPKGARKAATAGEVALAHLREQARELLALDPHVRLDAPDAVHQARVATRRLRSALSTFAPVLERESARAVREELRWWAGVLGGARDAEVMRDRLAAAARADAEWSPERAAAAAAALEGQLGAEHAEAHATVVTEMAGERYRALVAALEQLVDRPPLTSQAARPASEVLLRRTRRAHRALRDLVEPLLDPALPAGHTRDLGLHEARKAAKRARYAAEALTPAFPDAAGYAKAAKALQSELGEHQDSVVAREALLRLAGTERVAPHALALGRLHALEQVGAQGAGEQLPALWEALSRRDLRAWARS